MMFNPDILKLLQSKYNFISENEFGYDFAAKDMSHRVHLSRASVSFFHSTNREMEQVFGTGPENVKRIKAFLDSHPSWDEEQFIKNRPIKKK